MPKFILVYRSAKTDNMMADPGANAAWEAYLNNVIRPKVVDPGWPVFEPSAAVGETGPSTQLGGYSVVTADDLQTAVSMAKSCPSVKRGGGVEVGLLAPLPEVHPAEQMRSQQVQAKR